MSRALFLILAALLVTAPTLVPRPALAGLEAEAGRQLGFAQAELDKGEYERAIKSAESALRLDPTLYDAFVIKALAYEGLRNLSLAESLLVAYQEFRKGLTAHPEVAPALERIRAARSGDRSKPGRVSKDRVEQIQVEDAGTAPSTTLDPGPYEERVRSALEAGQCANAQAAASELTLADPHLSEGFRLKGDAERCSGRNREAVLAYRKYAEFGGEDPTVLQLTKDLAGTLGTLVVLVEIDSGDAVPFAVLNLPGDESVDARMEAGGRFVFRDLPVAAKASLFVAGRGLEPKDTEVPPLVSGQSLELTVSPKYIGLATVELSDHAPGLCSTLLLTAEGSTPISPGQSRSVTAGRILAVVSNEQGDVEVPLEVPAGSVARFDPVPWLPSALTIVGVPAGSTLRVFVEGQDGALAEKVLELRRGRGEVDESTGVRLAPPTRVPSLLGGVGGVFVSHARLGEGSANVALQAGSPNATTFQWRGMGGVGSVEAEYQAWQQGRSQIKRRSGATIGLGLGLLAGSAAASGVFWALAAKRGREGDVHRQDAIAAQDSCVGSQACPELVSADAQRDAAYSDETRFVVIGSITAGTAVLGGVLTGVFGAVGKKAVADHGEWEGQ